MTSKPAAALLSAVVIGFGVSHAQYAAALETNAPPPETQDYGYPAFSDRSAPPYADPQTYWEPRRAPYGSPYDELPPGEAPSYDRRYGNAPIDAYQNRANPRRTDQDRYGESQWNDDAHFSPIAPYRPNAYGPDARAAWEYPDPRDGRAAAARDYRQSPPPRPEWGREDWARDPYAPHSFESPPWEHPAPYPTPHTYLNAYREKEPYRRDLRPYDAPWANAETPYANRPPFYPNPNRLPAYPSNPPYDAYRAAGDPRYGASSAYPGLTPGHGFAPGMGHYPGLASDHDSRYWSVPGIGDIRFPGNFGDSPFNYGLF